MDPDLMESTLHFTRSSVVVFKFWTTAGTGNFILSLFLIALFTFANEGLDILSHIITRKNYKYNTTIVLLTFTHTLRITIHYFLMLVVMTYDASLFLTVICTSGAGYAVLFRFRYPKKEGLEEKKNGSEYLLSEPKEESCH